MVHSSQSSRLSDKRKTADMAYLILADKDGEFDRRDLRGPMTVGRALDCSICVRDILLSRKHCQIERFQERWVVTDLGSKNGTRVGNETITRHILSDGDVIRIGKIQICFHAGKFVAPPKDQPPRRRDVRPTDPSEALSGTVLGFQLFDMEEDSRVSGFPIPKPKPPEPASMRQETVQSMVAQIASSSWDLIVSEEEKKETPARKQAPQEIVERREDIRKQVNVPQLPAAELNSVIPAPADLVADLSRNGAKHDLSSGRSVVIRSKNPNLRATIPGWLAGTYIAVAATIGVLSLTAIVMRSILH